MPAETVNLHIWGRCNLRCTYCYGRFPQRPRHLSALTWCAILDALAGHGVRRVTFSGGEPTLHPGLEAMLTHARRIGLQTSIITNGVRLTESHVDLLDLVAVTVDSARPTTLLALGRGADYLSQVRRVAALTHGQGRRLKINTVVCRVNADEDLTDLVRSLRPVKWKPLQFVHVAGENDADAEAMSIPDAKFEAFVARHRALGDELWFAPESSRTIRSTYVMVDPAGRFFQHGPGGHLVSDPLLEAGVSEALAVVGGYDRQAFLERGGHVDIRRLPVVSEGRRRGET